MSKYSEEYIGLVIDHIHEGLAKTDGFMPSITLGRPSWELIVRALQMLNSNYELLLQHNEFAQRIYELTGKHPLLPDRSDDGQGRLEGILDHDQR